MHERVVDGCNAEFLKQFSPLGADAFAILDGSIMPEKNIVSLPFLSSRADQTETLDTLSPGGRGPGPSPCEGEGRGEGRVSI